MLLQTDVYNNKYIILLRVRFTTSYVLLLVFAPKFSSRFKSEKLPMIGNRAPLITNKFINSLIDLTNKTLILKHLAQ